MTSVSEGERGIVADVMHALAVRPCRKVGRGGGGGGRGDVLYALAVRPLTGRLLERGDIAFNQVVGIQPVRGFHLARCGTIGRQCLPHPHRHPHGACSAGCVVCLCVLDVVRFVMGALSLPL